MSNPFVQHRLAQNQSRDGASDYAVRAVAPMLALGLTFSGSSGWESYRVQRGDNLEHIAAAYDTSVARLARANGLPDQDLIYAGSTIRVPARARLSGRSARGRTTTLRHLVRRGDTLWDLAERYRVDRRSIARANGIPRSGLIRRGEVLVIPGRVVRPRPSLANTFAGRTYPGAVVSSAARNRAVLASRRVPTRTQMRDLIARTARRHGVPARLALAISWQESGWNMRAVSVANAIGAMQVIPATGSWVSGIVGRRLNLLDPEDNATAGVVALRVLLRSTGSQSSAIAAYYQGLHSVRTRGLYPDTRRYVASVRALERRFG